MASASWRLAALLVAGAVIATPPATSAQGTTLPEILAAAGRYVEAYKAEFFGVVATERYDQTVRSGRSGMPTATRTPLRRVFDAEVAILALDGVGWVGFRDIVRVDGKPVTDRTDRLMKILTEAGPDLFKQGRALADEGSRFNLGSVIRTINHPVLAFTFLSPDRQDRSEFSIGGTARIDGIATTVLKFNEVARPGTVAGAPGKHVQASGRYWVEPLTGRIVRVELQLVTDQAKAVLTSRYGAAPSFTVLVPLQLDETFESAFAELIEGRARYSAFRRFAVDTLEKRGGGAARH